MKRVNFKTGYCSRVHTAVSVYLEGEVVPSLNMTLFQDDSCVPGKDLHTAVLCTQALCVVVFLAGFLVPCVAEGLEIFPEALWGFLEASFLGIVRAGYLLWELLSVWCTLWALALFQKL